MRHFVYDGNLIAGAWVSVAAILLSAPLYLLRVTYVTLPASLKDATPAEATFVGREQCIDCHTEAPCRHSGGFDPVAVGDDFNLWKLQFKGGNRPNLGLGNFPADSTEKHAGNLDNAVQVITADIYLDRPPPAQAGLKYAGLQTYPPHSRNGINRAHHQWNELAGPLLVNTDDTKQHNLL